MNTKIINLFEIPNGIKVFLKYMDEKAGKPFYSRCYFIALCDDGSTFFADIVPDLGIEDPCNASNYIGVEIADSESWLSEEEFYRQYRPDEH